MTQEVMAKEIGISYPTIQSYESGKLPKGDYAIKLAQYFECTIDYLLTGEGGSADRPSRVAEEGENFSPDRAKNFSFIPLYNVQASAGHGTMVEGEQIVDYLAFKTEWLKNKLGVTPERLGLITVVGDSMEPTIGDGDLILINTGIQEFKGDALYVLNVADELQVKRLQQSPTGDLVIYSDNPAYKPFTAQGEQKDFLKIVGRVVWFGRQV